MKSQRSNPYPNIFYPIFLKVCILIFNEKTVTKTMVSLIYKIINSSDLDMEPLYVYYSGQLENVKVFPDSHDTLSEI